MLRNLDKYNIILASNSPRRKELLGGLDLKFQVKVFPGLEESYPESLPAQQIQAYTHHLRLEEKSSATVYRRMLEAETHPSRKTHPGENRAEILNGGLRRPQ